MTTHIERRARELMLDAEASRRYIAIAQTNTCPDCHATVGRFEHEQVTHARLACPTKPFTTLAETIHAHDGRTILGVCACGNSCSTHPDAANPLASCGDCGANTCPDCRVEDAAQRCCDCANAFYRAEFAEQDARDAADRAADLADALRACTGATSVTVTDGASRATSTNLDWLVINALRVAAEQWRSDAQHASRADMLRIELQFTRQADAAMTAADEIEAGAVTISKGGAR